MKELLCRFQVKPDPDKPEYYTAFVFTTKEAMWAHSDGLRRTGAYPPRDTMGRPTGPTFEAQATSWERWEFERGRRKRLHPQLGEVIFHHNFFGAGVVSHEMTHAALYWLTRKRDTSQGFTLKRKEDEKLAEAVGNLNRQFWNKWFRKYPEGKVQPAR